MEFGIKNEELEIQKALEMDKALTELLKELGL